MQVDTKAPSSANSRKSSRREPKSINGKKKKSLVLTGCSAHPFLKKVLDDIGPLVNKNFDVRPVENRYFGETVTVAGLLSAKDVIRKAKELSADTQYGEVLLPRAMFNHAGYTLDGYSSMRIEKIINLPLRVTGTVEEIIGVSAHG
jgi:NifB/MoaA-like Fe-S oxidoreductase